MKIRIIDDIEYLGERELEIIDFIEENHGGWAIIDINNHPFFFTYIIATNRLTENVETYITYFPLDSSKIEIIMMNFEEILQYLISEYSISTKLIYVNLPEINAVDSLFYRDDLYTIFIRKKLEKDVTNEGSSEFVITSNIEKYKNNILSCLKEAYKEGTANEIEKTFELDILYKNLEKDYIKDTSSLVCINSNNEFCGHITWEIAENKAIIVDSFVLKEYQELGISQALTIACEEEVMKNDIYNLEGTIIPSNDYRKTKKIYTSLNNLGWEIDLFMYIYRNKQ